MTITATVLILATVLAVLIRYARHDHFAGLADRADDHDDLGPVDVRRHLVPRWA